MPNKNNLEKSDTEDRLTTSCHHDSKGEPCPWDLISWLLAQSHSSLEDLLNNGSISRLCKLYYKAHKEIDTQILEELEANELRSNISSKEEEK